MNTPLDDAADLQLRDLLGQADPEAAASPGDTEHLLERVRSEITAPEPAAEVTAQRPPWVRRHWQGALLAAAAVAALALAAPTALPGLSGGTDADQSAATTMVPDDADLAADVAGAATAPTEEAGRVDASESSVAGATAPTLEVTEPALVRSANLLVGTEDIAGQRDAFAAAILALGGRITSETVVTEGSDSANGTRSGAEIAASDVALSSPYPWYPTGPGVWLSVEVPVDEYDEAVAAARATGEVVQMQQSSYDAGTQIADVDARITALEASLARLTDLLGSAEDVGDVIALEQAISSRQAERDSLRAQQRTLANQTSMSRISLTLMSPEDARGAVGPEPGQSWWESFLEGLGAFWTWLGTALLIVSPLLIAVAIIWWVRRRQDRGTDPSAEQAA